MNFRGAVVFYVHKAGIRPTMELDYSMKTLRATLAAVTAVSTMAAPALAQPYNPGYERQYQGRYEQDTRYGQDNRWNRDERRGGRDFYDLNRRQEALERRIEIGVRNGDFSRYDADSLRYEFRQISWIEARYRNDGYLSRGELAALDARLDRLEARIRSERRDRDDEYGYGYGQRFDRR